MCAYRTRGIINRGLYIFYPIFTADYNQERLILFTKQEILGLDSTVYNQEWFQIKSGLKWRVYGKFFFWASSIFFVLQESIIKPNYFKKQCSSSSFLLT